MPSGPINFRAVCGRFVAIFIGFMTRRAQLKAAMRVHTLRVRTCCRALLLAFVMSTLLYRAGDCEKNPGPPTMNSGVKDNDDNSQSDNTSLNEIAANIKILITSQQEMKQTMETKFQSMETSLNTRLQEIEHTLQTANDDIAALNQNMDDLVRENTTMKKELQNQRSKIDYMENQSRRQNLLFHNIPRKPNETWDDCESAVRDVLKNRLKITADVMIDRAHRVGTAIVARLQNYKDKNLILRNARKLKNQDTNIGISEDFSSTVREKRRGLLGMLKQYQQDNVKAALVYDKLLSPDGVFTYDTNSSEIRRIGKPRPGYTGVNNNTQRHRHGTTQSSSQSGPAATQEVHNRDRQGSSDARAASSERHSWAVSGQVGDRFSARSDSLSSHSEDDEFAYRSGPSSNTRSKDRRGTAAFADADARQNAYHGQDDSPLRGFGRGTSTSTGPNTNHRGGGQANRGAGRLGGRGRGRGSPRGSPDTGR